MKIVKKKNCKSPVWIHFGLRADDRGIMIESEKESPICRVCGGSVPAKGGNTTNLYRHLKDHHTDLYTEVSQTTKKGGESSTRTKQLTIKESVANSSKYGHSSPQAKEMNRAIAYCIAKDAMPLFTVENQGLGTWSQS